MTCDIINIKLITTITGEIYPIFKVSHWDEVFYIKKYHKQNVSNLDLISLNIGDTLHVDLINDMFVILNFTMNVYRHDDITNRRICSVCDKHFNVINKNKIKVTDNNCKCIIATRLYNFINRGVMLDYIVSYREVFSLVDTYNIKYMIDDVYIIFDKITNPLIDDIKYKLSVISNNYINETYTMRCDIVYKLIFSLTYGVLRYNEIINLTLAIVNSNDVTVINVYKLPNTIKRDLITLFSRIVKM